MNAFVQDVRFAFRQLRKAPGFTLMVVVTLALGIGATTSVFSLVEGVLLRPLPFRNPERLVLLGDHIGGGPNLPVTAREIATYSTQTTAFISLGAYIATTYELSGGDTPEEVNAARFTAGVFPTLGVSPILGRVFTRDEEDSHLPVAAISYALWTNRYHRDPHVLGNSLILDRKAYAIIGVMPRSFEFPVVDGRLNQAQVWVPMNLTAEELSEQNAGSWGYQMVARLKDGVTVEQAAQDTDRVAKQVMREFPASMSPIRIQGDVRLVREYAVADVRPLLHTLFVAVFIVLLIACVNVAGLLLVRAIRRRREYAVRLVLGAGSGVVIRKALFEGLLVSLAGGLLGLGFAATAIRTALYLLPESMPRIDSISLDATVAAFALLLSLACGALCSLAPAFAALNTKLSESLKEGTRSGSASPGHAWLRSILVVAEIGVALVLLTASAAFLRSFQKMRAVDPGFRPDHVLVAGYQLPLPQYSTNASVDTFNHSVVDRLANKPGMAAVGITSILPASGAISGATYTVEDQPAETWKLKFSSFATTYGDYFRAMDIPLIDGRYFTVDDRANSLPVVIVNQSMARHCWPDQHAIGKHIHIGNPHKGLPWATVVGVVADTKRGSRDEPSDDQWYIPAEQPAILYGAKASSKLTSPAAGFIALRSAFPPEQLTQTLRATIAEIDPQLALNQVQPMDDVISNVEAPRRFNTDLITAFALAALLLTIIGIYSLVAFSFSQRTQEIAIRMALGSTRAGIARLVLSSGLRLSLIGCGLGILGSLVVSRFVGSFLFEVSATDPLICVTGALIMIFIALLASVPPATRAATAHPIEDLRSI